MWIGEKKLDFKDKENYISTSMKLTHWIIAEMETVSNHVTA
jgi:hypothetical protein